MKGRKNQTVEIVAYWQAPDQNSLPNIKIVTGPTPLNHSYDDFAKILVDEKTWGEWSKQCRARAGGVCESCGEKIQHGGHAIGVYDVDFFRREIELKYLAYVCDDCAEFNEIRQLQQKTDEGGMTSLQLLGLFEKMLMKINLWNQKHPDAEPVRIRSVIVRETKHNKNISPLIINTLLDNYQLGVYQTGGFVMEETHNNWMLKVGEKEIPYTNGVFNRDGVDVRKYGEKEYQVKLLEKWEAPRLRKERNDDTEPEDNLSLRVPEEADELTHLEKLGRIEVESERDFSAILATMPNIPKPLQGPGCQPRTILSEYEWREMRKNALDKAKHHCELCGANCGDEATAHELFSIDYMHGIERFERVVCLCQDCHFIGMHSGRALTRFRRGTDSFYTKERMLSAVERIFREISDYNLRHPDDEPLRAYATFLEYLRDERLKDEMERLITYYDMEFWHENNLSAVQWGGWKMIFDGKIYHTPYDSPEDFRRSMEDFE